MSDLPLYGKTAGHRLVSPLCHRLWGWIGRALAGLTHFEVAVRTCSDQQGGVVTVALAHDVVHAVRSGGAPG